MYCIKHKDLIVYGWCLMSNHVHLIMGTRGTPMPDILRDLKKYTSKRIVTDIRANPQESRKEWMIELFERAGQLNPNNQFVQFWQQHNKPIELDRASIFEQKLEYVHRNPVEAGWVEVPEAYLYSSARDYAGLPGLIDVTIAE